MKDRQRISRKLTIKYKESEKHLKTAVSSVSLLKSDTENVKSELTLQYLKSCSINRKEGISEWNKKYEQYLKDECVRFGLSKEYENKTFMKLLPQMPGFKGLDFSQSDFSGWYLENVDLSFSNLSGSNFSGANLDCADLWRANLQNSVFHRTLLRKADLWMANLSNANLYKADLKEADLLRAKLSGADFDKTNMEDTNFKFAVVNEATLLLPKYLNANTNFTGVNLSSARFRVDDKRVIEKNIRRIYWEKWYKKHKILQYPLRLFWWLSEYGSSTKRCLVGFSVVYIVSFVIFFLIYLFSQIPISITPTIISDIITLMANTLLSMFGLGNLYSELAGIPLLLLTLQVICGYGLLAVIITRIAIIFQER